MHINQFIAELEELNEMYNLLPTKRIYPDEQGGDGWVRCELEEVFKVNSFKALKEKLKQRDIPDDIFTVFDTNNNRLFTEEDMDNLEIIELCPDCRNGLGYFSLEKKDIYGCDKCQKEVTRDKAIKLKDLFRKIN
jgi:hypothetical protein